MDEIINFLEFYKFINGNKLEEMNFPLSRIEFGTHLEFCAYHEYFAFGKALLGRLYQKVKIYINNLLSVYI